MMVVQTLLTDIAIQQPRKPIEIVALLHAFAYNVSVVNALQRFCRQQVGVKASQPYWHLFYSGC
jgi:hypothetical protein